LALVLAVGRIFTLGRVAGRLGRQFAGHELVAASLANEAFARIGDRVPDIVVFPQSLFPTEKAALVARLREWTGAETHDQPPVAMRAPSVRGADGEWFYWFKSSNARQLVVGRMRSPRQPAAPAASAVMDGRPIEPSPALPVAPAVDREPAHIQEVDVPPSARAVTIEVGPLQAQTAGPSAVERLSVAARAGGIRAAAVVRTAASRTYIYAAVLGRTTACAARSAGRAAASGARLMSVGAVRLGASVGTAARRLEMPSAQTRRIALRAGAAAAAAGVAVAFGGGVVRQVGAIARVASARRPAPQVQALPAANSTVTAGSLNIVSEPSGATVAIDGHERGVTPLVVNDLAPGQHVVALAHENGSVRQTVRINANETASVDVPLFTGWVAVFAPFELRITDGGKAVVLDEQSRAMLSPGTHQLQFTNRALGFHTAQSIAVRPGQMVPISIVPPNTPATLTSNPPSEVWIDGARVGQTPLQGLGVAIGTREFLFRSAEAGERRVMKTVTTQPFRLDVDLTKSDQ
jgi:hypothetical protein